MLCCSTAACYRLVVSVCVYVHVHLPPLLCNRHQTSSKAQDAVSGRGLSEIHGACAHTATAAAVCNAMSPLTKAAEVSLPTSTVKDVLDWTRVKLHV